VVVGVKRLFALSVWAALYFFIPHILYKKNKKVMCSMSVGLQKV